MYLNSSKVPLYLNNMCYLPADMANKVQGSGKIKRDIRNTKRLLRIEVRLFLYYSRIVSAARTTARIYIPRALL